MSPRGEREADALPKQRVTLTIIITRAVSEMCCFTYIKKKSVMMRAYMQEFTLNIGPSLQCTRCFIRQAERRQAATHSGAVGGASAH